MVEFVTHAEFELFRDLIYNKAGIRLKDSKKVLVANRLRKRMDALGMDCYSQYYQLLKKSSQSREEMQKFINALTTNETYFFRHPEHFEFMTGTLIPEILKRRKVGSKSPVRIWSAACASGEEPYSIAIQIRESVTRYDLQSFEIFGSDINYSMIQKAEAAVYGSYATGKMNSTLRDRYFTGEQGAGVTRLKTGIRNMVRFHHGNLLNPFPHGQFDVIFCRNVLIYFDQDAKDRVLSNLHRSLNSGGYLITGYAESLMNTGHPFQYQKPSLYRKID